MQLHCEKQLSSPLFSRALEPYMYMQTLLSGDVVQSRHLSCAMLVGPGFGELVRLQLGDSGH